MTLFVQHNEIIEKIRKEFNPVQHQLIAAHVTLCREDEIKAIDLVIENIKLLRLKKPLRITFDQVARFEDGKGVLIPANKATHEFDELRREILKGVNNSPRQHQPHVTLMHPRNSTCTDYIFDQIRKCNLPAELSFDRISLIEQENDKPWRIKKEFLIVSGGQNITR